MLLAIAYQVEKVLWRRQRILILMRHQQHSQLLPQPSSSWSYLALLFIGIAICSNLTSFFTWRHHNFLIFDRQEELDNEYTDATLFYHRLSELTIESTGDMNALHEGSNWVDYDTAVALVTAASYNEKENLDTATTPDSLSSSQQPITVQPYTIHDALYESSIFKYTFCILVYDPQNDKFIMLYSKKHEWKSGNSKMWKGEKKEK